MKTSQRPHAAVRCFFILFIAFACRASSASWKEQVLYSFQGGANDGADPAGGVVFDKAGNLYGATAGAGGENCTPIGNECGLVYELSPPAENGGPWTEKILYQFQGKLSNDGSVPEGGVSIDSAGNLYGTTAYGGTGDCVLLGTKAGCGTVYELSPPPKKGDPWTETLLYSFTSGNDGYFPWGDLTFDAKGNLYGATQFGGGKGNTCNPFFQYCGTVFELSPPKQKGGNWIEDVLHSFAGGKDGANPQGGLALDKSGALYGTAQTGGNQGCKTNASLGCGTLFELKPPTKKGAMWKEEMLHVFTGGSDGAMPNGNLVFLGPTNRLYGTVQQGGGSHLDGAVFQLTVEGNGRWVEKVLHDFSGGDGWNPAAGVIADALGHLYGTVTGGGAGLAGTSFELRRSEHGSRWAFTTLYAFTRSPDGASPSAPLTLDKSGHLYGTTLYGGNSQNCGYGGCGTVFEMSP